MTLTTTDFDQSITYFEDLSNDLFYEIFDYLDNYNIYQSFYGLNKRLKHLLLKSTYPIEINLSSISKLNFFKYYNQIIYPNKHRIKSFLANQIFTFRHTYYNYCQVQTLILENIQYIFISVEFSLPKLSTLIIDEISYSDSIYNDIYSISSLNYCKLTFKSKYNF